jgi:hypothetical protein
VFGGRLGAAAVSPLTGDFYVSTMPVDNGNANTIVVYAG